MAVTETVVEDLMHDAASCALRKGESSSMAAAYGRIDMLSEALTSLPWWTLISLADQLRHGSIRPRLRLPRPFGTRRKAA